MKTTTKDFNHNLKIGDILWTSWGWEQTNIDWWEVVAVPSGKSVKVRQLNDHVVEAGFMSGPSTPVIGSYKSHEVKLVRPKFNPYNGVGMSIKIDYGYGTKWDGSPRRCSWYA